MACELRRCEWHVVVFQSSACDTNLIWTFFVVSMQRKLRRSRWQRCAVSHRTDGEAKVRIEFGWKQRHAR